MKTVDLSAVLDDGDWGGYQKALVGATALTIVFDGLDNQVLSGALPAIMRDWHVPRSALTPALTAGFVGMMFGGFIGGVVGDKLGRRVALLGSVVSFGMLTLMVSLATSPLTLIGAALPCRPRSRRGDAERGHALVRVRPDAAPAVRRHPDDRLHPARRLAGRVHRRPDSAAIRLARPVRRLRLAAAGAGGRPAQGAAGVAALSGAPQGALGAN